LINFTLYSRCEFYQKIDLKCERAREGEIEKVRMWESVKVERERKEREREIERERREREIERERKERERERVREREKKGEQIKIQLKKSFFDRCKGKRNSFATYLLTRGVAVCPFTKCEKISVLSFF
jgi:hypothetical protein